MISILYIIPGVRALIDIPDNDLKALDRLGVRRGLSRANIVRQAIREYLAKTQSSDGDAAFGLWRDRNEDGLDYQSRVRAEW